MSTIEKLKSMARAHWEKGNYAVAESLIDEAYRQEHSVQANGLVRCKKCNALIETTVHCDNCGTFEPTRR